MKRVLFASLLPNPRIPEIQCETILCVITSTFGTKRISPTPELNS